MGASPGGQPPARRHASRSSVPAARWIAPSTPPPPNRVVLAALTIASTACRVISPWTAPRVAIWANLAGAAPAPIVSCGRRVRRSPLFQSAPAPGPAEGRYALPGRDLIERVRKALGDRYTVLTAVGRGGNASIFAARDSSGADVAIKVLHPELTVSVAADRFLREIRFASQLNHPHIARMMDSGEADYLLWYVMPYLPGDTLRQTLRREVRLPIPQAVAVAAEVLDALEHAHAHGIAHRDIKPDNIVLAPPPQGAVLVDLRIARAIASSGDDRVTRSGFGVGTEEYMSPEQAQGVPDVDGRTDLYSLGVVLFECLAGRPPFSSPSAAAVLDMHQHNPAPDLHSLRRDVPAKLAAAVAPGPPKTPAQRWARAPAET